MRVLIHTMYFWPEFGSAPILMDELAADMARRGYDVEVVTTLPRPPQNRGYEGRLFAKETRADFRVLRFPTNFTAHPLGRLLAWTIYSVLTVLNLARVRRGDIVFLRLPPLHLGLTGVLARRLRGARVLLNVQDIHPDLAIEASLLRNRFLIRFAQAFERWIYRGSDEILVISEGFRTNLERKGVARGKIAVLPNWVDTRVLRPLERDNPVARRFGLTGKFVLMYSGTISLSSFLALERVLEAAGRLGGERDLAAVIVGEGLKKKDLADRAEALGLRNVAFLPFQPYADLPYLLASADVLLVPLDKEKSLLSVPSKLYHFMAAGRPILGLAHRDSEVYRIISETGCGLCAPPDDPEEIAAAVRRLKTAPEARREMGERARRHVVEHFSREKIMDDYGRLLSSGGRS